MYSNPEYVKIIEAAQQKILKQLSFFDNNYLHPSIIANLAQTYVETAGQINPRILVRGNAEAFKDINHTNRIRACLFTGLQLAHLWKQLGGSSWSMILLNVSYYKIFKLSLVYSIRWYKPMLRRIYFYVYSKIKESV